MIVPQWVPVVASIVFVLAIVFGIIQRFMMVSRAGYGATVSYVLIVGGLVGLLLFGSMVWYKRQVAETMSDPR